MNKSKSCSDFNTFVFDGGVCFNQEFRIVLSDQQEALKFEIVSVFF